MTDHGPNPYVTNIETATVDNANYRTTIWTGKYMQLTVMSIKPGEDVGMEVHEDHDQFLRVEAGKAKVEMGPAQDDLQEWTAEDDDIVMVPAGTWHNLTNIGDSDLKLYSLYAPPEHPHGTIHATKADSDAAEAEEEE